MAVRVAFRVGVSVAEVGSLVETPGTLPQPWSMVVVGSGVHAALRNFCAVENVRTSQISSCILLLVTYTKTY